MSDGRWVVHAPLGRVHGIMWVATVAFVGAAIAVTVAVLLAPMTDARRASGLPGLAVTLIIAIGGLAFLWAMYLGHQRMAIVDAETVTFRSWIRFGRFGTDRAIPLEAIEHALLLRPHHVELQIPGRTRARTVFEPARQNADRVNTFWWWENDYSALRQALEYRGIHVEYRHVPGVTSLLNSW